MGNNYRLITRIDYAYRLSRSNTSSPTSNTTATSGRKTANRPRKPRFSRRKYAALLSETLPRVIATSQELERLTRQIEPLIDKGERRTPEEEALCCLSLKLIDDYQQAHRSIPEMKPHELLQALIEESGTEIHFKCSSVSGTPHHT